MESRFIIGIDLGTTNCAVAYVDTRDGRGDVKKEIRCLEIPQVTTPGVLGNAQLLPSFSYQIRPGEFPAGSFDLPWQDSPETVVGMYARDRGAEVPDRVISSSKSWLSCATIDRTAPLLPWDAPKEVAHISPIEASGRLLTHIRQAWNHLMAADHPGPTLETQEVFLTVPASFDATARQLTVQAAEMAGISRVTLLEEPQAAFYAWLANPGKRWQDEVHVGDVILVCDIGGGTTDFSLILVSEKNGELALERIAVGEHILLGGDNMDLALAYAVRRRLAAEGMKLDGWQMRGLLHSARRAKEALFADPRRQDHPVTILGKGRKVIGGTITTELSRHELETVILDGFFPQCAATDRPAEKRQVGLKELGLPYASDPAVTRHLAWFLERHQSDKTVLGAPLRPTLVLFNGGVMKAEPLQRRIVDVLRSWAGSNTDLKVLSSRSLDLAVAYGGVTYGLARRGKGIRIRSGTERSYYIGIESAMPSVPGMATPIKALCVVPFGMEEGSQAQLPDRTFGLVVGQPVSFRFFGSTTRHEDRIGDVIEDWEEEGLEEMTPIETQMPAEGDTQGAPICVHLHMKVTEIGTLELWFVSDTNRWKLEFSVRSA